jgi:hypothetical protein
MSYLISNQSGDWDTAANWDTGVNTPTLHASTNLSIVSTSQYTQAFTAPSITDYCTGASFLISNATGTGTDYFLVALQEYDGATWNDVATETVLHDDISRPAMNHFRFGTPYQFTTVTVGYYRFRVVNNANSVVIAADSGGSNPSFIAWHDVNNFPVAGDHAFVESYDTNELAIKVVGTEACGNADSPATDMSWRSWDFGLYISAHGKLEWDTAAASKLDCKGHYGVFANGDWEMDGATAGAATDLTLEIEHNTASGDFGVYLGQDAYTTLVGALKTTTALWKAKYVQGDGTTGTPLEVDAAVDWDVDDRIFLSSTTAYNQYEIKYIKTKVSTTEYTLADTPGGAESGLSYTHTTDVDVVNAERNVKITAKNASYGYYFLNQNSDPDNSNVDISWTTFENPGGASVNRRGVMVNNGYNTPIGSFDYNVIWEPVDWWGFGAITDKSTNTYTGLIQYYGDWFYAASTNKSYVDCFALYTRKIGFYGASGGNISFENCVAASCNYNNYSYWGGFMFASTAATTLIGCETHASRRASLSMNGMASAELIDCNFSYTDGRSQNLYVAPDTFNTVIFKDCLFNTGYDLVANYTDLVAGSRIAFHRYNDTDNKHFFYEFSGIGQATGATLDDTNVRTAGSLACRLAPEDGTTGLAYEFKVLARAGRSVFCNGFVQKNAAMSSDDIEIEIYLPGSTSPDDSVIMPYDTDWNSFIVEANYLGLVDDYAIVKIIGKSTNAGAYAYVDDIYNGTDEINGLDVWYDGYPSSTILPQVGDPELGWQVPLSGLTIPSTTGARQADMIDEIWDEVLTGATHNVPASSGRRIRQLSSTVVLDGTAVGSGTGTDQIELNGDAATYDGAYDPAVIAITSGTGIGQCRMILEYDGATKIATVDRDWKILPDATSEYIISAHPGREHVNEGLLTGAGAGTAKLNPLASTTDDIYVGQTLFIRAGTGADQAYPIISYDGATQTATLNRDWEIVPDTTSAYVILPPSSVSKNYIAESVWDAAIADHDTAGSFGEWAVKKLLSVAKFLGLK